MSAIFLATGAPPTGQAEGSLSPLAIAAASPSHPGYPQPPQLLPGSASLIALLFHPLLLKGIFLLFQVQYL